MNSQEKWDLKETLQNFPPFSISDVINCHVKIYVVHKCQNLYPIKDPQLDIFFLFLKGPLGRNNYCSTILWSRNTTFNTQNADSGEHPFTASSVGVVRADQNKSPGTPERNLKIGAELMPTCRKTHPEQFSLFFQRHWLKMLFNTSLKSRRNSGNGRRKFVSYQFSNENGWETCKFLQASLEHLPVFSTEDWC